MEFNQFRNYHTATPPEKYIVGWLKGVVITELHIIKRKSPSEETVEFFKTLEWIWGGAA